MEISKSISTIFLETDIIITLALPLKLNESGTFDENNIQITNVILFEVVPAKLGGLDIGKRSSPPITL
jgi:hypothetical protein